MRAKPETVEDALLLAYANFKLSSYGEMLVYANEALKLRPDDPISLHYKALALKGLGDLKGAEAVIRTAIEKDKHNYSHLFLLGLIQWSSADLEQAEENLKKAISYSPKEAFFHVEYATFLIHNGKFEEALDAAYKAKNLNDKVPKVNEIIKSARAKEFKSVIDAEVYEPPYPYDKKLIFSYLKIGEYYLENNYLANAQSQFAKALEIDSSNTEAMAGFATAARLREGGFYHFARNFSQFLTRWYILATLGAIVILFAYLAVQDPEFMVLPLIFLSVGLVVLVTVFVAVGLKRKDAAEFKKILAEWNVDNIEALLEKMKKISTETTKEVLEQEAVQNKARTLVGYSNLLIVIFWICLIAQISIANLNTAVLPVESQDAVNRFKIIFTLGLVFSVASSLWLRSKARSLMEESESKSSSSSGTSA